MRAAWGGMCGTHAPRGRHVRAPCRPTRAARQPARAAARADSRDDEQLEVEVEENLPSMGGSGWVPGAPPSLGGGNNRSGDGCRSDCQSNESCGNRIVDIAAGEVCDSTPLQKDELKSPSVMNTVNLCSLGRPNAAG